MIINNHGDIILLPIKLKKPPKNARKGLTHILQKSETTGNRHEIVSKKEPIFVWEKDEQTFIYCSKDYEIRHVGGDEEHGVQKVEKGTRKLEHELEHDPWKKELKIVVD